MQLQLRPGPLCLRTHSVEGSPRPARASASFPSRGRRRVAWDTSPGAGPAGSVCVPGSGAAGLGAPYQPLARLPGSPQRVRAPARVPRARPLFPPSPRPHVSALYRGHLHLNLFTLSMFFDRKSFKFEIVDSSLCFLLVKILTPHLTIFERRTRWPLTSLFSGCSVRVRFGYKEQKSWLVT